MEEQIKTNIAQEEQKVETPQEEVKEVKISDDPEAGKSDPLLDGYYKTNPFFYEVANYFNVEQRDFDTAAPKLSAVVDWVVDKFDAHTPEDILLALRKAESMVMAPYLGEKRYTNLYKYAILDQREQSIKKAKKAFERNSNGESN